jgi:hypothetical protein
MILRIFQCLIHKTHLWKLPTSGTQETALLTFNFSYTKTVGQDKSVSTMTHYRLRGLGIKSWWGRDFLHLFRPALEATQPPTRWVMGLSGGKAAGAWR